MKLRILSLAIAVALLAALWMPAALADTVVSGRTSLAGASDNKLNNIRLAADAINGTRVDYGESFSFNRVVGARTQARGYRSAVNGRGVQVTGGGVGQAATTLYLALQGIEDGIRYDELSTYGSRFKDSYVEDGSLAVLTDYSAGTDFCFTNYAADMTINMWTGGGCLYCDITLEIAERGDSWFSEDSEWFDVGARIGGTPSSQTITARIPFDSDEDTAENIRLAADSVNDTVLASGDVFSFNKMVGPRTGKYGYVSGVNGRGVRVTGGGVAQVASVIWLAVKDMSDIDILEKRTYGKKYNQNYVNSAEDAIVTDYNAGTDFSFRYSGVGTVTICTYVDGGNLRCDVVRNGQEW